MSTDEINNSLYLIMTLIARAITQDGFVGLIEAITAPPKQLRYLEQKTKIQKIIVAEILKNKKLIDCLKNYHHYLAVARASYDEYGDLEIPHLIYHSLLANRQIVFTNEVQNGLSDDSLKIINWLDSLFADENNNTNLRKAFKVQSPLKSARWPITMEMERAYKLNVENELLNHYMKTLGVPIAKYIDRLLLDDVHDFESFEKIKMKVHELLDNWQCLDRELLFGQNESDKHSLDMEIHEQYEKKIFMLRRAYNEFYILRSRSEGKNKKRVVLSLKNLLLVCVKDGYGIERIKGVINIYTHALNMNKLQLNEIARNKLHDWARVIESNELTSPIDHLEASILLRNNLTINYHSKNEPAKIILGEKLLDYCVSGAAALDEHFDVSDGDDHLCYRKMLQLSDDNLQIKIFKKIDRVLNDYLMVFYDGLLGEKEPVFSVPDEESISVVNSMIDNPQKILIVAHGVASRYAQYSIAFNLLGLDSVEINAVLFDDYGLSQYIIDDLVERLKGLVVSNVRVHHVTSNPNDITTEIVFGSNGLFGVEYKKYKKSAGQYELINNGCSKYNLQNIINVWKIHSKIPCLNEFEMGQQLYLIDNICGLLGGKLSDCAKDFISLLYSTWNTDAEAKVLAIYDEYLSAQNALLVDISRLYTVCRSNHFYEVIMRLADEGQPYLIHLLQEDALIATCNYFMLNHKFLNIAERQYLSNFSWMQLCATCHADDLYDKFKISNVPDCEILKGYSIQSTKLRHYIMLALHEPFASIEDSSLLRQTKIMFQRLVPYLKRVYFDSILYLSKKNLQILVANKLRDDIESGGRNIDEKLVNKYNELSHIIMAGGLSIDSAIENRINRIVKSIYLNEPVLENALISTSVMTAVWITYLRIGMIDVGFRKANTLILPLLVNKDAAQFFEYYSVSMNEKQLLEYFQRSYISYFLRRLKKPPFQSLNHDFQLINRVYVQLMICPNIVGLKDELILKGWQVLESHIYYANNSLGKSLTEIIQLFDHISIETALLERFNTFMRSGDEHSLSRLKAIYKESLDALLKSSTEFQHNHAFVKQSIMAILQYVLGLLLNSDARYLATVLLHCKNYGWSMTVEGYLVVDDPILNDLNLSYEKIYSQVIDRIVFYKEDYTSFPKKTFPTETAEFYRGIDKIRETVPAISHENNTLKPSNQAHQLLILWNRATVKLSFFEKQRLHTMTSLFIEISKFQDNDKEEYLNKLLQAKNLLQHLNIPGVQYSLIGNIEKTLDEMESACYINNEKSMIAMLLQMIEGISHRVHAHDYLYTDHIVMDSLHELEFIRDYAKLTSPDLYEIANHLESIAPYFPHLQTVCCLTKDEVIFLKELLGNLSGESKSSIA